MMRNGFENGRPTTITSGDTKSHCGKRALHADREEFNSMYIIASRGGALQSAFNMQEYVKRVQSEKNSNALRNLLIRGKERSAKLNSASQVVKLIEDK